MSDEVPKRVTRSQTKNTQRWPIHEFSGGTESEGSSAGEERSYKKTKSKPEDSLYPNLGELNAEFGETLRQRRATRSRSRSTSPARSSSKSRATPTRTTPPRDQDVRKQEVKDKVRTSKSSSTCRFLLLRLLTVLLFSSLAAALAYSCYPLQTAALFRSLIFLSKEPAYTDVLEKYKSDFIGPSKSIAETAIEKFIKTDANPDDARPVVLLFYGHNQTKIGELYLELAGRLAKNRTIFEQFDPRDTVTQVRYLKTEREKTIDKLKTHKIILFNGIESLKGSDYMQLYGFVDEADAHVQNCLIVISFYSDEIKAAKLDLERPSDGPKFDQIQQMESHVKGQLKRLWREVDISNLEAFFNRIIAFPSFVF